MARINIEDSLFKDARFLDLMIKTGNRDMALGMVVRAFMVAQSHFLTTDNDRLIPIEDWKKQGCSDLLIEVGLAEIRGKNVYVSGSEKQFAWLIQRQNAGKSPKTKKKKRPLTGLKRNLTEANGSERVETSISNSISISNSSSISSNKTSNEVKDPAALIFLAYNENRGELPEAKVLNKDRREKCRARWKEVPRLDYWREVFSKAAESSFLTGATDRGWKANFDWLTKNGSNHVKVYEGAYDRGSGQKFKNQGLIDKMKTEGVKGETRRSIISVLDSVSGDVPKGNAGG